MPCWREMPDGLHMAVRVTPKAGRDGVSGFHGGGERLAVSVRALPDKGAANKAVAAVLASWLGVPKSTVHVVSGTATRLKTVSVTGAPAALVAKISAQLELLEGPG